MDYSGRNLSNESFKRQDLSGKDFSGSDLRGTSFQSAILERADFSGIRTGKSERFASQFGLLVFSIIVGIFLGFVSWQISITSIGCGGDRLDPYMWIINPFGWTIGFATTGAISRTWIFRRYLFVLGFAIALIPLNAISPYFGLLWILVAIGFLILAIAGIIAGYRYGSVAIGSIWVAIGVSSAISAGYSIIALQSIPLGTIYFLIAIVPTAMATRSFHRHFARIWQASKTSFRGANLQYATFRHAVLEDCDFRSANLKGVEWDGATIKNCKFPPEAKSEEVMYQERSPESVI